MDDSGRTERTATGEVLRTPDEAFADLDFPFEPHWADWYGLRQHYVDERPGGRDDVPVFLLLHGEPTWSHLYRQWIPRLVEAGFRCVAPDHIGFGKSDKPTHDDWYDIERHCEVLADLIDSLDLRDIHLVVQDWGGPIGLRQLVDRPDRFSRVFILNTWLHHDGFEYSPGIEFWHDFATDPAQHDLPCGEIVARTHARPGHDLERVAAAYEAPFPDARFKAGARRFPWLIPNWQPVAGNAENQQRCYDALLGLDVQKHVVFGASDPIFTADWGRTWASRMPGTTFDAIPGASHFVQDDAPDDVVDTILGHLS